MDGENNGKTPVKMDDLEGPPLFSETPNIELFSSFANKKPTAFEFFCLIWSVWAVRFKPKFELDKKNTHNKLTNHL